MLFINIPNKMSIDNIFFYGSINYIEKEGIYEY